MTKRNEKKLAFWVQAVEKMVIEHGCERVGITAGYGAGKTHGMIQNHLKFAHINARSTSWFVSSKHADNRLIALPLFHQVLQNDYDFQEGRDYRVMKGSPMIIDLLRTKNRIEFKSFHDPETLVGSSISHATVDEAGFACEIADAKINNRIRCPNTRFYARFDQSTPEGITQFYNIYGKEFPKFQRGDSRFVMRTLESGDKVGRIVLPTFANPFLKDPIRYSEKIISAWKHDIKRVDSYLYGLFVAFAMGVIARSFKHERHVAECSPNTMNPLRVSFDFNAYPLAALVSQERHDKLHVLWSTDDQMTGDIEKACLMIIQKFGHESLRNVPVHVYGDRTGHASSHKAPLNDFDRIKKALSAHFTKVIVKAPKAVVPEAESAELVERAFAYDKVIIHPRCVKLIDSLVQTCWKEGTRKIEKPSKDLHTHWFDALKYLLYVEQGRFFPELKQLIDLRKNYNG